MIPAYFDFEYLNLNAKVPDLRSRNSPMVESAVGDIYSRRWLASPLCILELAVGIAIALQRDGHCVAQWDPAPSM